VHGSRPDKDPRALFRMYRVSPTGAASIRARIPLSQAAWIAVRFVIYLSHYQRFENMDNKVQFLERLHHLEREVLAIKSELLPESKPGRLIVMTRAANEWFRNYFPLISAVSAALVILIAYFVYHVDPLQSYRETREKIDNERLTKQTSEFYTRLGEKLLNRAEFKSAENAFNRALEIRPTNLDATVGVLRSQIFKPLEGQKYYKPEVVEAKLAHLRSVSGRDDYIIYYYEGILQGDHEEYAEAKKSFAKAAEMNPNFIASYNMMGMTTLQAKGEVVEAISNFQHALEIDPRYAATHFNLGSCYLLVEEYDKAIEHLDKSDKLFADPITAIMLGDAYLYKGGEGSIEKAFRAHELALSLLDDPNIKDVEYISSSIFNYMPSKRGDRELTKNYVYTNNSIQNKAFAHYALSFDYALLKRFREADVEFAKALGLESRLDYSRFFQWKIFSLMNFLVMDEAVKRWFQSKKNFLYKIES
jgi:tetratricopeptide (TPR) repeat protein